jgi:integrase
MKDIADYLEKAQVDTIRAAAKARNLMDRLIIRMLWRSGVQVGELLNAKPEDIEFHNQIVNIVKVKRGKQRRVMLEWRLWRDALRVYFQ